MTVEHLAFLGPRQAMPVPPEEMQQAEFVMQNLKAMSLYVNEASDCIQLYHALGTLPDASNGWFFIPAKQVIVGIYNYRMAMDAVVTTVTRVSKHLKDAVDTRQMETAKQEFRSLHPHTKELRQSILHQAELSGTLERVRETALRREETHGDVTFGGGSACQSNLVGDALQMTFQGQIYWQSLSLETAGALTQNAKGFIAAFSDLGARVVSRPLQ